MKKWTGGLISLVILILITYYVMGLVLESTLNKNLNSIPKTSILNIHLDKYQRGWFSSQAILAIQMHIPEQTTTDKNGVSKLQQPIDFNINFPLIINHGPIIFTDYGVRFGMGHVTTRPQTHYSAFVNYLNTTYFKYTFPSFDFKAKSESDEFQFSWLGLSSLLGVSSNLNKLNGNFILYGLNGSANHFLFNLGEVFQDFKLTHTIDGLWIGQTHFSISSMVIKENEKLFDLEALDLALSSDIAGGTLNFNSDFSLKKLVVADKTYGPGILKIRLKNLDPAVMANINKQEWNLLQNNPDSNLAMLGLLSELPKLLAQGPELEVSEMSFSLPEGIIIGNFKITLPKDNIKDTNQLLQKIHGEGQLKASIPVVRKLLVASIKDDLEKQAKKTVQMNPATPDSITVLPSISTPAPVSTDVNAEAQKNADKFIQDCINKGILKVDGNDYIVLFKLENQTFTVNGQRFTPDMLQ